MVIRSFRLRLTLVYTGVVLLMFFIFGLVIYLRYSRALYGNVDEYLLRESRDELSHELSGASGHSMDVIKRIGDEYYEMITRQGKVLIASLTARKQSMPVHDDLMKRAFDGHIAYVTYVARGEHFRMIYFPVAGDRILRVALSLREVDDALADLRQLIALFSPLILFISAAISWYLSGKALAPVVKITTLAEQVRQGRLGKRIEMDSAGKEVSELVRIFNEMLDSIQRSVEAQKRFTSDVSHEIRSPLTSLRGGIEVALRKRREPEEYESLLQSNLADIIRIARITDNLLFFAKADNNIIDLRKQWFDVNHALRGVIERLRYRAEAGGVTIIEEIQDSLEFYGDVDLLEQAFSNLIDNGIKYTPAGGVLTVRTAQETGSIVVRIIDSGVGIPGDDLPHIFERFYRVDKERSRKSGGTGLGLSITQWIITAHDGTISVTSTPGKGSVFVISLPLSAE